MAKKDYYNAEAIEKLKSLAENARICMMATKLDSRPNASRPMALQEVDKEGILWFISDKESDKNHELQKDADLQLYFIDKGSSEYLSVYGKAEIYTDQKTIDDKWSKMADAWFEDGKEDPDASIIGVTPVDVKYWESNNGKLVDMALMLYNAVTGSDASNEAGKTGNIHI